MKAAFTEVGLQSKDVALLLCPGTVEGSSQLPLVTE